MNRIKIILLYSLIYILPVFGQEFKASVDRLNIGQNQRFQVDFTFAGGDINDVKNFKAPDFKGFRVLSGPNRSSSVQIVNGRMSSSLVLSYILQGSDLGSFIIGPASVTYGSKTYTSNALSIKIVSPASSPRGSSASGGVSNDELAKNVFLVATPNKRKVVKGEEVIVTYKLYTRLNISSPQIQKLPNYQGFWSEDLEMPKSLSFENEMYNGVRFRTLELKKVALFANQSGELEIEPLELVVPVIIKKKSNTRDLFDEFFNDSFFGGTETIEFVAKANDLKINITEPPVQGRPASFTGIVGDFKLDTQISKTEADVNESISLKFTISGRGNIKLLDIPQIELPAGFEKYDPKYDETISRKNSVSGKKVIEYLLVPRIPGKKIIKPVEFSFYNPSTNRYVTLKSPEYELNIKQGNASPYETAASGFSKEDVKLLSQDIRYIKTSGFDFQPSGEYQVVKTWFWFALIFPFVGLVGFIGFRKRQDKLSGNVNLMRSQKAEKAARSRLKNARKYLSENKLGEFYAELSQALFGYLEDKLSIGKADFTLEKALKELASRNVSDDLLNDLQGVSEKCEYARFAPQADGAKAANQLYEDTITIIVTLENKITKKKNV